MCARACCLLLDVQSYKGVRASLKDTAHAEEVFESRHEHFFNGREDENVRTHLQWCDELKF